MTIRAIWGWILGQGCSRLALLIFVKKQDQLLWPTIQQEMIFE